MYKIKTILSLSLCVVAIMGSMKVNAANSVGVLKTNATLAPACAVQVANINLGSLIPGHASSTASSDFQITCTKSTAYTTTLNFSQYGTDCFFLLGANSGDKFYYGVTLNGSAQGNTTHVAGTGTGNAQTLTYSAIVQSGGSSYSTCPRTVANPGFNPYVTPDTYSDTVQYEVDF